jgi:signal peptidase II
MIYLIAVVIFLLDQLLKWVVRTHMHLWESIPVWPHVLYLNYIRNNGGAFSIFPNQQWLFVLVALVVVIAVVVIERRTRLGSVGRLGFALVLGGALGNMADRVISGSVVDYVYFKIINFPVFNLADVAIDLGVFLLVIRSFQTSNRK